jgi:hypothetical protein
VDSLLAALSDEDLEQLASRAGLYLRASGTKAIDLAPHVGCRRVVFVPNWRHSVSCRVTCRDIFQSCRRHKKMSCRVLGRKLL